ncbi:MULTISPECIES: glutaredoxin-like protein NrdH [Bifidobacterium]|uniref:Glutaredoxin-like protein NrdH n=2 Tax=Bifidobacterium TaxID=1678 RepID=M4RPE7_9BIFI|nr:glutaredoxin-like protein NrdH [Bifidobacterium thermophilum]AGH40447.1 glutaredoxin [Bifidobacterium thermophilum RBL67]MDW8485903.1 glutaredoxin-like protein NrdH [Bifidobacterium thermophilum]
MTITVFTKPQCQQCEATKRRLHDRGIAFETVDLSENPETLTQLIHAGYRQAPVVITPDAAWSGYRPDLIDALAGTLTTAGANAQPVLATDGEQA